MAILHKHTEYGDNIKKLRLAKEMRQVDLAAKMGGGWTQADISQLESNERVLTLDTAAQIAKILGVSVNEIIGNECIT